MKNNLVVNDRYEIMFLWKTRVGKMHDSKALAKDGIAWYLPTNTPIFYDTAYIGLLKQLLEHELYIPKKSTKLKKLSNEEKMINKIISSFRVKAEHVIAHTKKFNIVSMKFRNRVSWNYWSVKINLKHEVMSVACGLQNLHAIYGK